MSVRLFRNHRNTTWSKSPWSGYPRSALLLYWAQRLKAPTPGHVAAFAAQLCLCVAISIAMKPEWVRRQRTDGNRSYWVNEARVSNLAPESEQSPDLECSAVQGLSTAVLSRSGQVTRRW